MELKALLTYARPYTASLVTVVILSLTCALGLLALPWIAGRLLGSLLGNDNISALSMAMLLAGVLAALAIMQVASAIASANASTKIEADFKGDIFAHVQRLPMEYFDRKRQGDLLALLTWEVSRLGTFVAGTLAAAPAALLTAVGASVALFMIEPSLASLALLLVPFCYLVQRMIGRELRGLSTKIQKAEASIFASAQSNLEMLPATKAFAREEIGLRGYRQVIEKLRRLKVRRQKILATVGPALLLVTGLGGLLLILLTHQTLGGAQTDPAAFVTFLLYLALLICAIFSLAGFQNRFSTARGTLERLNHVLGKAAEPGYAKPPLESAGRGWISFNDVWFGYPRRHDTLRGVDFDIEAGEIVALTGESGAGKSTILALLLAFYTPRRGTIKIDGCDIAQMSLQQARGQIGYVPQHPLLQNGSIRENLTLGQGDFSLIEIKRACKLAQAHDFIMQLPDGYRTQIGDHGDNLSASQRQRLALARALLTEPPILVLDEATSHLDAEDEAALVELFRNGEIGSTTIIVSHRPAMLALADRILTIKDGKVSETGRRAIVRGVPPSGSTVTIDQPG